MSKRMPATTRDSQAGWILFAGWVALSLAGLSRWLIDPSYWLDEAYIAINLESRGIPELYSHLTYHQWFPRIYLSAIHLVQDLVGPSTRAMRFLPLLWFVLASGVFFWIVGRRFMGSRFLALLAVALLLPVDIWIFHAAILKQYSLDVLLGLLLFAVPDKVLRKALHGPGGWWLAVPLTFPLVLSYVYPIPLAGRLAGMLLADWKGNRRLRSTLLRLSWIGVWGIAFLSFLYAVDLRHNVRSVVDDFWAGCVLGAQISTPAAMVMPVARLLFAWHKSTLPLACSLLFAGLLLLGVVTVATGLVRRRPDSLLLGSVLTLGAMLGASLVAGYPICRGRVTLIVLPSILFLMLAGAEFLEEKISGWRNGPVVLLALGLVLVVLAGGGAYRAARLEAPENLRPLLTHVDSKRASRILVHDCTIRQWMALPEATPEAILLDAPDPLDNLLRMRESQEPTWVIWTHLEGPCQGRLDTLRGAAVQWEEVYLGPDAGLALAGF